MEAETRKKRSPGKRIVKALIALVIVIAVVLLGARIYFRLPVKDYYNASEAAFAIPGLAEGFVPQGLAYDGESGCYLVGGYAKGSGVASPIYAVNRETGETVAHVTLANPDETAFTGHAGGLAVWGDNVYVAGSGCLYVFDHKAILSAGIDGLPVQWLNKIETLLTPGDEEAGVPADSIGVAWVDIQEDDEGALVTVGEFYRDPNYPTPETHKFTDASGESLQALAITCRLSEDGLSLTPIRAYALPDLVQGFTVHEGKIYLSTSWGVAFSHIDVYDEADLPDSLIQTLTVNGADIPLYALGQSARSAAYRIAPMSEEIIFSDGKLLTMCESASRKYYFGLLTGGQWCYATDLSRMTPAE